MDSKTLAEALLKLNKISSIKHSIGIYSADKLPSKIKTPAAIIVHSENSDTIIGHWLAIYVAATGQPFYFDSYGLEPYVPSHITFLNSFKKKIIINRKCFQAPFSTVCGGYCLLFLAFKMAVIKNPTILKKDATKENDKFVKDATKWLLIKLASI